jgi:hypothetical protein
MFRPSLFVVKADSNRYSLNPLPRSQKVRWYNRLPTLKIEKHQATSDNYQNSDYPNQSNRHRYPFQVAGQYIRT